MAGHLRALTLTVLLAVLVPLAGCLEASAPPAAAADPKEEALAFSLLVVGTYFTQDSARFLGMVADEVYTLEGEGPYTRADVAAWVEEERPFPSGRDHSMHTMEEYLSTYAPRVLAFEEAAQEHPEVRDLRWEGWTPDADDYVFLGSEPKEGKTPFMWDDLLAFAVTRETGEWRFKAFSG